MHYFRQTNFNNSSQRHHTPREEVFHECAFGYVLAVFLDGMSTELYRNLIIFIKFKSSRMENGTEELCLGAYGSILEGEYPKLYCSCWEYDRSGTCPILFH